MTAPAIGDDAIRTVVVGLSDQPRPAVKRESPGVSAMWTVQIRPTHPIDNGFNPGRGRST